jgi:hypothetical protein
VPAISVSPVGTSELNEISAAYLIDSFLIFVCGFESDINDPPFVRKVAS